PRPVSHDLTADRGRISTSDRITRTARQKQRRPETSPQLSSLFAFSLSADLAPASGLRGSVSAPALPRHFSLRTTSYWSFGGSIRVGRSSLLRGKTLGALARHQHRQYAGQ